MLKKELIYYLFITCVTSSTLEAGENSYYEPHQGDRNSQRSIKLGYDNNLKGDSEEANLVPFQSRTSFVYPDRDIENQQSPSNQSSLSSWWKGLCWIAGGIMLGGAVIGGAKLFSNETPNAPAAIPNGITLPNVPIRPLPLIANAPGRKTTEQLRKEQRAKEFAEKSSLKNYPYTKPTPQPVLMPTSEALQGVQRPTPATKKDPKSCSYAEGTVLGSYQCVEGLWRQMEAYPTTPKASTSRTGWKRLKEVHQNGYHVVIEGRTSDKHKTAETASK